ncbi:hypothetical protein CkaCkLH20_12162 [Colletotrichum karsti]|uniref:Secondary metabolism regulator LAE1 n=1 Tax=Colletotrichum karsti TaxID=1095194 RepID=A0A9P6LF90_9PEZI|nr:uncharacterized protein CkaCkLH20_12162 [Colletotrichum karsti]KAF9870315.1 hypothetical protein CkaCkLH20_12162 [Colletotrichum karsti]
MQHHLFLRTLDDALGLAPPNYDNSRLKRVLDVGTGTGIWAIDFADDHPEAEVIGVDLSPSAPEFIPPNVKFEIDDIEEDWTWSRPFDYIHSRFMNSSISDWRAYIQKAYNHLTPGGYFELQEVDLNPRSDDGTLRPDSALSRCIAFMGEASLKLGHSYQEVQALVPMLEEIGFVDVRLYLFKWPMNPWPKLPKYKELGQLNHENTMIAIEALTMAPFTRGLGWTKEQVEDFLVYVRRDLSNPQIHSYWAIYDLCARKPTEAELRARGW